MSEPVEVLRSTPCPICGKPALEGVRPFCSRRCADVDLNRWFNGVYAVPVEEDEDEDGAIEDNEATR
ncbi:MAG: DNA gyrase inhibitor YacG [Xanthobacteraceae bacterium]